MSRSASPRSPPPPVSPTRPSTSTSGANGTPSSPPSKSFCGEARGSQQRCGPGSSQRAGPQGDGRRRGPSPARARRRQRALRPSSPSSSYRPPGRPRWTAPTQVLDNFTALLESGPLDRGGGRRRRTAIREAVEQRHLGGDPARDRPRPPRRAGSDRAGDRRPGAERRSAPALSRLSGPATRRASPRRGKG